MKLKLQYCTKEKTPVVSGWYSHIYAEVELEPVRIIRFPADRNKGANNRYRYEADYAAPADAEYTGDGMMRININRKTNPHFDPKKLEWVGNVASV